ncbi:MAG: cupin domain-containing protein [Oscillospiraceae bacterium]|nr:cupin domain-containing protein [Oscillospiraceae bacterium]
MKNEINEIADRIRELRESCDYSVDQMAEALNVDPVKYRAYEETGEDIPISVIYDISKKFKVDFNEIITGTPSRLDTYHIVRRGQGKEIDRYPGYRFEDLAYKYSNKIMQPLLITLDPHDESAKPVSHPGQEFNLVLEGEIVFEIEGKVYILKPGDSVYFNARLNHKQACSGDEKARFLTVISE